ncbi:uracil-xanthine permease family protein [Nioella nitratireducens]|uniref:uracil-xanthine permease family protein n=1 Tax=Nioella nitratireducens TaxID=1287720 RepID=UPI0008FCF252|nr:nucleobase:cation symporter-2 family protein [Nioella nitratireducens]
MADTSIGTAEQLRDPNYMPPLAKAVPLGIQHVLAMFVSNVTPAIIVAGAAGIGFGSDQGALGFPDMSYMIQMSMLFAGIATLIQTIGFGPVGARLPIVQGTSFAFVPIMIPAVAGLGAAGLGGLMTGVFLGGIFHFCLGFIVGRIRFALPPLVTGLIVLMIGLALIKVGIQYAAGGVLRYNPAHLQTAAGAAQTAVELSDRNAGMAAGFGTLQYWGPALVVVAVTLLIKFFTKGFLSIAAVFLGIVAGYIVALLMGQVSFANVGNAALFQVPMPFHYGFEINWAIVIGMCFMAVVSAIETVGDTSGITKGGAGREATDEEIQGATFADGLGTAIAGVFGGLPNTSFSQNVGLVAMTGVMSRHVVTIGGLFLIVCGCMPVVGAIIRTMPEHVLGGGVIVMFGMVCASGINMLSDVTWNRRNMVIFATSLSVGFGLQLVPEALQHLGRTAQILLTSGLLPTAALAIILNLVLPHDLAGDEPDEARSTPGHGEGAV